MKKWIVGHKIEIIIFVVALIVRVALFAVNFSHNEYDLVQTIHGDDGYYEISQGLLNGHGFTGDTVSPFRPTPLRPPLWPAIIAFLAGTFGSYWAVAIFQILMGSLIPVLGRHVARYIISDRYATVVGFLLALEPYSVLLSFILYTETSFTFLFLLFLLFLFRYTKEQTIRNVVWAGVFLGLATLVKPTVQYFPIIIPLVFLFVWRKNLNRRLLGHLGIFIAVFCLLIAPWLYRNHYEFDVWGMSAQPAFNLYVYLVPTVLSIDNHTDFATELRNVVTKDGFDVNTINLSNSKVYADAAIEVLKDHKSALVKSAAITVFTFFTHDGMLTVLNYAGVTFEHIPTKPAFSLVTHPIELIKTISYYITSPAALIIIMRLVWIIMTFLFLGGFFLYVKREGLKTVTLLILIIVLYFSATTAINGLGVNARFKIPINVFILSFAVYRLFEARYTILGKLNWRIKKHESA